MGPIFIISFCSVVYSVRICRYGEHFVWKCKKLEQIKTTYYFMFCDLFVPLLLLNPHSQHEMNCKNYQMCYENEKLNLLSYEMRINIFTSFHRLIGKLKYSGYRSSCLSLMLSLNARVCTALTIWTSVSREFSFVHLPVQSQVGVL